jgi:dGTPase
MDDTFRLKGSAFDASISIEPYRSQWRRDCARLIHSASFRRLQGKTQLFPGTEIDFFRNRLTHSLEVAQIAKSIAIRLNYELEQKGEQPFIQPDVAEFAGLSHDLGHPPFGHFGEQVLDEKMKDSGGFESNAQTMRILTKTEKKFLIENAELGIDSDGHDKRVGLDLTVRSLASILKYDKMIPATAAERTDNRGPVKGYYPTESDVVRVVKQKIIGNTKCKSPFKTIECQIMDIADDIAYSTYDLEDSFKAGFTNPIDLLCASDETATSVARKVSEDVGDTTIQSRDVRERMRAIFFDVFAPPVKGITGKKLTGPLYEFLHFNSIEAANRIAGLYAKNGYYRTDLTSKLVGLAISKISMGSINTEVPLLSQVQFDKDQQINVGILKHYLYESQILSLKVQMVARRSREIIATIFDALSCPDSKGYLLLPDDFKQIYLALRDVGLKRRVICDFIAGMTDRYAMEYYGRLTSEDPHTIFKPL